MNSNWTDVLKQIEPEYDTLSDVMKNGPNVRAVIRNINRGWRVRIEEDWGPSNGEYYYTAGTGNLDSRCEWAAEQLKDWKFVGRLSHQEWKFLRRKDAEKFIMMYSLKWAG